jgi:hypothetical protein
MNTIQSDHERIQNDRWYLNNKELVVQKFIYPKTKLVRLVEYYVLQYGYSIEEAKKAIRADLKEVLK